MACLNEFITANATRMRNYLESLCDVSDSSRVAAEVATRQILPEGGIDVRKLDLSDLFELHRLIWLHSSQLITALGSAKQTNPVVPEFLQLVADLGPPPSLRKLITPDTTNNAFELQPAVSGSNSSSNLSGGGGGGVVMDTSALEQSKFLFISGTTKDGWPVAYLIVNRIRMEFLQNINLLIHFIFKVFEAVLASGSKYALVIDVSWAVLTNELKSNAYAYISQLSSAFSHRLKKSLGAAYIVHPTSYTRAVIMFMKAFTSSKLSKKIIEIYNWKELTKYIELAKIALPESSQDFITKAYKVNKINAKGKTQSRLVKFTSNSLLNIDPKTHKVQNEKLLVEIEEISILEDSNEIRLKFQPQAPPTSPRGGGVSNLLSSFQDPEDQLSRRYVCANREERDEIIRDIFTFGFHASEFQKTPLEFRVVKVNNVGKKQDRVVKLTCDSILNLDANNIRSETSFAGIDSVLCEKNNVFMKFKSEDFTRQLILKDATEARALEKVLLEAMRSYNSARYTELESYVAATSRHSVRAEDNV